jgi:hypothetical protein
MISVFWRTMEPKNDDVATHGSHIWFFCIDVYILIKAAGMKKPGLSYKMKFQHNKSKAGS